MSYQLIITDEAYEDLHQIVLWYNEERIELGYEFIEEAEKLMQQLKKVPHIFRVRKKRLRVALLNRFPYVIIYEIEKENVVIYSVVHSRRHPKKRYSRTKHH